MPVYKPLTFSDKNRKVLTEICNNAAQVLREENGIDMDESECIYTIVVEFLKSAATVLANEAKNNNGKAEIEIHKFMKMGVSMRESDDAEKGGNMVPTLTPGESFKMAIKNDGFTEDEDK